jgi:hypothetical protein
MAENIDAERASLVEYLMLNFSIGEGEADFHARYILGRRTPSASIGEDELPEVARAVIAELEKNSSKPDAPGHCHQVAGVWDMGNRPEIAGKPCEWCALWNQFKQLAGRRSVVVEEDGLPPLPTNVAHVTRRIRRCESDVPAQVVLEHFAREYGRDAIAADRRAREGGKHAG